MKLKGVFARVGVDRHMPHSTLRDNRNALIADLFVWAVGVTFFLYWWFLPYMGDDLWTLGRYREYLSSPDGAFPWETVIDEWCERWYSHHFRIWDMALGLMLLVLPKWAIDVISGIMVVVIIKVSTSLAGMRGLSGTVAIAALFTFAMQWISGLEVHAVCINYVWSLAVGLLFIRVIVAPDTHGGWLRDVGVAVVAFLAGASHEAMSLPLGCAFAVYVVLDWQSLSRRKWCALAMFYVGVLLIVVCPGLFVRRGLGEPMSLVLGIYTVVGSCFLLPVFVVLFLWLCRRRTRAGVVPLLRSVVGILLVAAVIGGAGAIWSGMPGRAPWFAQGFALVGTVACAAKLRVNTACGRWHGVAVALLAILTLAHMVSVDCVSAKAARRYRAVIAQYLNRDTEPVYADMLLPKDVMWTSLGKVRGLQFVELWQAPVLSHWYEGEYRPMEIVPAGINRVRLSQARKLPGDNPIWEWQGHWVARRDEISSWNVLLRYPLGKTKNITLYHATFVADDGMEYVYLYPYNLLPRNLIVAVDLR